MLGQNDNPAQGVVLDGYKTPGGTIRQPILLQLGVGMWVFNSSTNAWTSLGVAPPAAVSNNGGVACVISTYDAIWLCTVDAGFNPYYWFFKRGAL